MQLDPNRQYILFTAMSMYGNTAGPEGDRPFLSRGDQGGIFPKEKRIIMRSRKAGHPEVKIEFDGGDIPAFMYAGRQASGGPVFQDGGAGVVRIILSHRLIGQFIPIIQGLIRQGVRIFATGMDMGRVSLISVRTYPSGLVQLQFQFPN